MTLCRSGSFGCCGCSRRLAAGWGLRCPAAAAGLDRMYACKRSTGPLDGLPCADCPGRTGRTLRGSPWPLSSARLPVRGSRPGAIAAEKKKFPPVLLLIQWPVCIAIACMQTSHWIATAQVEKFPGRTFTSFPEIFLGLHMPNLVID